MPGMAPWRQLYRLEYQQLFEEGYPVGDTPLPDPSAEYIPLPQHDQRRGCEDAIGETEWETAYHALWQMRGKGLRPGFPYHEPDGLAEMRAEPAAPMPSLQLPDRAELEDRVAGAWLGRCAGVTLGKPVEMWRAEEIKGYLQDADAWPLRDYVPPSSPSYARQPRCMDATLGNIGYVPVDDDISYTVSALRLVEEHGREFTKRDVCTNWLSNLPYIGLYSCTKQAYYHLVSGGDSALSDESIAQLPLRVNPMREGLNASIRIDLFGFISPADPASAIAMAHRNASVNSVKNGIYAATFVASCIAAAFSRRPTVELILDAGLAAVPKRSRFAEAVALTRQWYDEAGGEWEPVCRRVFERWGHHNWAGAILNFPLVVLALIHGQLNFGRTIATAVMCGIDTDCTAGTLGGIVGAAVGRRGLPSSWYEPFNDRVRTFVAGNGHGDGTISNLIARTLALIPTG